MTNLMIFFKFIVYNNNKGRYLNIHFLLPNIIRAAPLVAFQRVGPSCLPE